MMITKKEKYKLYQQYTLYFTRKNLMLKALKIKSSFVYFVFNVAIHIGKYTAFYRTLP